MSRCGNNNYNGWNDKNNWDYGGGGTQLSTAKTMKTGQTTSYRTGDDGDIEAGRLDSFLVLPENNPFGNTDRFTAPDGTQTYTDDIVIDWSTYDGSNALGIKRTLEATAIWNTSIDDALASTHGGFTDWRKINAKEFTDLFNYNSCVLNYAPFNIARTTNISTSTTYDAATTYAWTWFSSTYQPAIKSNSYPYLIVRDFTVTGTTLT